MTITFYKSSANPRKVDKSGKLTMIGSSKALTPTEGVDMLNPVAIVEYNGDYMSANYAYIDTFARYYFIRGIALDTAGRIVVTLACDYLYSHMSQIKACPCTVVRSETAGINYVIDDKLPVDPNRYDTYGEPFAVSLDDTAGLDNHRYILVLNKGGVNNGT